MLKILSNEAGFKTKLHISCWNLPKQLPNLKNCMCSHTVYPNLSIFLHRYICHIGDILQLWVKMMRLVMLIIQIAMMRLRSNNLNNQSCIYQSRTAIQSSPIMVRMIAFDALPATVNNPVKKLPSLFLHSLKERICEILPSRVLPCWWGVSK